MKRLKVQTFLQKKGSTDCGPVSTRMILHHFGIEKTEHDLKKFLHYDTDGTSIYDNGLVFLREGLKTTLITANPRIFPQEVQGKLKTKESLLAYLAKSKQKKKTMIDSFKDFIKSGGKVQIEIPTLKHIKSAIDKDQLVLALIYGQALGSKEGQFHFVVVSGYKKDAVYLNNSLLGSREGWFSASDFIYALYSSTCADIDNGSLILVGK
ncbi:MAG: hypothetical protein JWN90_445 [Parcubacteria group bacterium]|nr:hypothetical protein [Parcubacteria group bacterium]